MKNVTFSSLNSNIKQSSSKLLKRSRVCDFRSARYFSESSSMLSESQIQIFSSVVRKSDLYSHNTAFSAKFLISSGSRSLAVPTPQPFGLVKRNFSTKQVIAVDERLIPVYRLDVSGAGLPKRLGRVEKGTEDPRIVGCGEDAYFVRPDAIAVADGVGGWAYVKNADAALYSRTLLGNIYKQLEEMEDITSDSFVEYEKALPEDLLEKAYDETIGILGSCTVCFAMLRRNQLRVANLGDCGAFVYRNGNCIFRTKEQQHSFNFPFQLGSKKLNSPVDAQIFSLKLLPNDVVILASDGLFDNLFDEKIIKIIKKNELKRGRVDPTQLSQELLNAARSVAESSNASCPFNSRALKEGLIYEGGKMDDISVAVGVVDISEDSPDRR